MGTFKMIVYPFGLAITALCIVAFFGMALFGADAADWTQQQQELTSTIGTLAGLAGAVVGLWLAIRSERHAFG
jgi:hypothetical protein